MELRVWAERVLTATTLDEKLVEPGPASDEAPGTAHGVPDAPGRPPGLGFSDTRAPFPGPHALDRTEARAAVLHFFANHELLALELLALALLRFPDAPPALRRGLLRVATEEQRHLAAYLDRMRGMGMELGALPLNRYFWTTLAPAPDPASFLAGLSLTFEQANLDHAAAWAATFRRLGDLGTAEVLDQVLADEIGHVRHGAVWLRRLTRTEDLWTAWTTRLPPPLTPVRARGPVLAREARAAAGLPPDLVERVATFGASKGRPPRVHSFEPGVEDTLAGAPSTGSATADRVHADLASLMLFLASEDDVVLAPPARPPFLAELSRAGFAVPELTSWASLRGRRLGEHRPWARSPGFAAWSGEPWDPAWARLYRKDTAATWAAELVALGVGHEEDVPRVVPRGAPLRLGEGDAAKAPFGTAGRGLRRGDADWAAAVQAHQGAVLVEPWRDRVLDLSVQIDVGGNIGKDVVVHPPGRFLTDPRGGYRGAVVGAPLHGLPRDVLRFYHEADVPGQLRRTGTHVGARLQAAGLRGPAGIDAFVYRHHGELRLRPLVEVNPRVTMGRVAQALGRRVRRGSHGVWLHVPVQRLRRLGVRDVAAWADDLRARHPLVAEGSPALIRRGTLFTTDPAQARLVVTVLLVDPPPGLLPPELCPALDEHRHEGTLEP